LSIYQLFTDFILSAQQSPNFNQLLIDILTSLKSFNNPEISQFINLIAKSLPQPSQSVEDQSMFRKAFSKIIGLSMAAKKIDPTFDVSVPIEILFKEKLQKDLKSLCENYLHVALDSKNEVKRVFSIISLTNIAKQKLLEPSMILASILILLNSDSRLVR
jgi:hypothetical protein